TGGQDRFTMLIVYATWERSKHDNAMWPRPRGARIVGVCRSRRRPGPARPDRAIPAARPAGRPPRQSPLLRAVQARRAASAPDAQACGPGAPADSPGPRLSPGCARAGARQPGLDVRGQPVESRPGADPGDRRLRRHAANVRAVRAAAPRPAPTVWHDPARLHRAAFGRLDSL